MEGAVREESASATAAEAMAAQALEETPCGTTPAAADCGVRVVEEMPPPGGTSTANGGVEEPAGIDFPLDPVSR
jgi:hypothetical protein